MVSDFTDEVDGYLGQTGNWSPKVIGDFKQRFAFVAASLVFALVLTSP